jgi:TetR/AcrR family transcriptional repressor of nem operon
MNIQNTDMRQHILDTAKPIILGKGFSAVGLNELLNAAEVPKGSFYHYFKSKEYFGEALLDSYFEAYLVRLEILLSAEGMNGAERLMSYWQRWLETQCGDDAETKCMVVSLVVRYLICPNPCGWPYSGGPIILSADWLTALKRA